MNKREKQKQQSSNAILKASMVVFGRRGYHGATYSEISKLAKVTNGLIVQRFNSRENLFTILFEDALVKKLPSLNECNNVLDGLERIADFIINLCDTSVTDIDFIASAFESYNDIPQACVGSLESAFIGTTLHEMINERISQGDIASKNAFDVFAGYLKSCFMYCSELLAQEQPIPDRDALVGLFGKWDRTLNSAPTLTKEEKISKHLVTETGLTTWYAEFDGDKDPILVFENRVLRRMGLREDEVPTYVYKYMTKHVAAPDKHIVKQATEKMLAGETVEFSFRWSSPVTPERRLRCYGKREKSEKGYRLEGFLQDLGAVSFLKNRRDAANLVMKSIAHDYDYVCYVHLGKSAEEDYVEEYKMSDFITKVTNNWEGKKNFGDRMAISLDKIIAPLDRDKFAQKFRRPALLKALTANRVYNHKFKIQYYGGLYMYEISFIGDDNDNGEIVGFVCAIRMISFEEGLNQTKTDLGFINSKIEREREFNALFVEKLDAAYLVNTADFSYEVFRRSDLTAQRNRLVPDFLVYIKSYIERDVYFEDKERVMAELTSGNLLEKINSKNGTYSINYRDISSGSPVYCKARAIKAGKNLIAVGIQMIDDEYRRENFGKEELEEKIRKQEVEIQQKNILINNFNAGLSDLMVDIVDSRRQETPIRNPKIRETTFILGKQIMHDWPEYGLTPAIISSIATASNLHDVGKLAIPESILYKKGKLTDEEFEIMKSHSERGLAMIEKLRKYWSEEYYKLVCDVCKYHHERFDGSGYPEGLRAENIPLAAQIVGITDVLNALVSERIYKGPYDPQTAFKMIAHGECGKFNPKLVGSLKNCFEDIEKCLEGESKEVLYNIETTYDPYKYADTINESSLSLIANMSEQMPDGFFIYKNDSEGRLLFFNDAMVQLYKCDSREDFIKHVNNSFRGIVHPEDYDDVVTSINAQILTSEHNSDYVKYRIITKTGEERTVDDYGHLMHTQKYGDIFYVFIKDVTDTDIVERGEVSKTEQAQQRPVNSNDVKTLEGTRILVVDDNDLSRFMTKEALEDEGAIVTDVPGGNEALKTIRLAKPYDIILVDLVMPDMDGAELTKQIREFEEGMDIHVPIIAITGEQVSELAKLAVTNGADGVMGKPLVIGELARLLILSIKDRTRRIERKLEKTIRFASTDTLTHVKNNTAYTEKLTHLAIKLKRQPNHKFGIIFADINKLKQENDLYGHDVGDIYIKNCAKLICDTFIHSPVYRIGGDEFAIVLEDEDLRHADELFEKFKGYIEVSKNIPDSQHGKASIAAGLAIYDKNRDYTVQDVVKRADAMMYEDKEKYHKQIK